MEIKLDNISSEINNNQILNQIKLNIKAKKFTGIIGPNGSGKSTLLKCIYRVLKPTKGAVFLDEINLKNIKVKEAAKKMAVVAQHNYYNFDFSVEEVVLMGRSPHKKQLEPDTKKDYDIAYNSLEKVDMLNFRKRSFSTLSGGEQQRVILARALAQQTECIILDEPTNHLDIKYQLQLLNIVKKLNLTVVAAIHDLNIASMYCDEIFILKEGKVLMTGTPKQVITKANIKAIYEVDADIIEDNKTGILYIAYKPAIY